MITLQWAYTLAGLMFAAFALLSALDRTNRKRFGNAAFWGLMALSLLAGGWLGDFGNGLLVLGLVGLAGFGLIGRTSPPTRPTGKSRRRGSIDRSLCAPPNPAGASTARRDAVPPCGRSERCALARRRTTGSRARYRRR